MGPGSGPDDEVAFAPLEGLRVVQLSPGMAASMAAMILSDHGASVTRVIRPAGDWDEAEPASAMWDRGKTIKNVDLWSRRGRAQMRSLITDADVVIEAFRPGTAARLGVTYQETSAMNPQIVHCSISGFGEIDELRDVKAYDATVAARAGLWYDLDDIRGAVDDHGRGRPIYKIAPTSAYAAAHLAVQEIIAAVRVRPRCGGQHVTTSLLQGASATAMRIPLARDGEGLVERSHGGQEATQARGIRLCFLTAQCADGRWLQMCARQDRHFRSWMAALDLSDIFDQPRYAGAPLSISAIADIEELEQEIRSRMRTRTQAEWMEVFLRADIGADPFLTPDEFLRHPQAVENAVSMPDPDDGDRMMPANFLRVLPAEGPAEPGLVPTAPAELPGDGRPPLEGVTVIELAYFLAAPLAGSLLAQLGARVIKIEPLTGDPFRRVRAQATPMLHGKESIALDLSQPRGREILQDLLRGADIVYTNFRERSHSRLGISADQVRALNPRAIHLYAASYGSRGAWAGRAAFHSTPNALCGAGIAQAGTGNHPVDDSWPDPVAGLAVATSLLLALADRDRHGRGIALETTMLGAAAHAYSREILAHERDPLALAPLDQDQQGRSAFHRIYPCRSGRVLVEAHQERERSALAAMTGVTLAAATTDAEAAGLLAGRLAQRDAGEWTRLAAEHGAALTLIPDTGYEEFMIEHGQFRPDWHACVGEYWRQPAAFSFSRSAVREAGANAVGESTRSILTELGLVGDEIDELVSDGVVGAGEA